MSLLPTIAAAAEMAKEAQTSETPFYVAGGLLAIWAVVVSALGLSRHDFPGTRGAATVVMAISVVLMLAAVSSAVLVSS